MTTKKSNPALPPGVVITPSGTVKVLTPTPKPTPTVPTPPAPKVETYAQISARTGITSPALLKSIQDKQKAAVAAPPTPTPTEALKKEEAKVPAPAPKPTPTPAPKPTPTPKPPPAPVKPTTEQQLTQKYGVKVTLSPSNTLIVEGIGDTGVRSDGSVVSPKAAALKLSQIQKLGILSPSGQKQITAYLKAQEEVKKQTLHVGGSMAFVEPTTGVQETYRQKALEIWNQVEADAKKAWAGPGRYTIGDKTITVETEEQWMEKVKQDFKGQGNVLVYKPDPSQLTAVYTLRAGGYLGAGDTITNEGIERTVNALGADIAVRTLRDAGVENPSKEVSEAQQRIRLRKDYSEFINKDGDLNLVALTISYEGKVPDKVLGDLSSIGYTGIKKDELADVAFWVTATPEQQFDRMVDEGRIPEYSTFVGVNKKGEFEYREPAFAPEDVDKIRARASEYLRDMWPYRRDAILAAGLTLPHDIRSEKQWQQLAEVKPQYTALGWGVAVSPYDVLEPDKFDKYWASLPDSERIAILASYYTHGQRAADLGHTLVSVIPVVGTVAEWDHMSTAEKVVSILFDVAIVGMVAAPKLGLLKGKFKYSVPRSQGITKEIASLIYKPVTKIVGGRKVITGTTVASLGLKGKTGKTILQVAKQSGQAHLQLGQAKNTLRLVQKVLKVTKPGAKWQPTDAGKKLLAGLERTNRKLVEIKGLKWLERRLMGTVQELSNTGRVADQKLADMLYGLDTIDPSDLRKLEKLTRIKGLNLAVRNVNKAQSRLTQAWARLEADIASGKLKVGTVEWTKRLGVFSEKSGRWTGGLEKLKVDLDKALVRFGEVLRPRVRETPALEFKGYQMQWDAVKPTGKLGKGGGDAFDKLMADARREYTLKQLAAETRQKELTKLGIGVATKAEPKVKGVHKLRLSPVFAKAKPKAKVRVKAPKVKVTRKGKVRVKVAGKPDVTIDVDRIKTAKPTFREPAPNIVAWYAVRTIEEVMGKSLAATELKTAQQINAEFQKALNAAFEIANTTYAKTGSMSAVDAATEAKLKVAIAAITQPKTQTKLKTAVETNVKLLIRTLISRLHRLRVPAKPAKIEIKRVEGKPERNPGIVQWDQGVVRISIKPPYREGKQDVAYTRIKPPTEGRGSPQQTIRVRRGKAPQKIELGMGATKATITRGKTIDFARTPKAELVKHRGPGLLLPSGRLIRQRKGTLLK